MIYIAGSSYILVKSDNTWEDTRWSSAARNLDIEKTFGDVVVTFTEKLK